MEIWSGVVIGILLLAVMALLVKIRLMRKSADEITEGLKDRLSCDTNTLVDISSRDACMCQLAAEINGQLKNLREERHRYQQGDLEIKDAVTGISHDIRTPLTAVSGYLELLKNEEMSETARGYLTVVEERTEALKKLTEELFQYSVSASGMEENTCEAVELNQALEESISAYYAALKGCRITPRISLPEKKVTRFLNRSSLARIFGNILSNAIKYSDGDLVISLSEEGEILFANPAPGLNEVQAGKLFERFYTVESGEKSTGLGLSIAKRLTQQMGGEITASFQEGILRVRIRFLPGLSESGILER